MNDNDSLLNQLDHTALLMIREDIKEIKTILREHQSSTKSEFERVRDKIDRTNSALASESKGSAIAIAELQTEQKHIASVYGGVSGFIGAVLVAIISAVLSKWPGWGG